LFYITPDSADCSFVSSFRSNWNSLYADIGNQLSAKEISPFQIRVGIVTAPTMPTLENGHNFFTPAQSYLKGRRIMTIIASSHPECKFIMILLMIINLFYIVIVAFGNEKFNTSSLTTIPRFIARRAAILLRNRSKSPFIKYWRRLLTVAIDNCVALDFLDMCEMPFNDQPNSIILKPENFERGILNLGNCSTFFPEIAESISFSVSNYIQYVNAKSNEYTLCGSFWNLLINILFRTGEQVEHRLEWEWESTLLYPTHPLRKVDLVCLAEFEGAGGRKVLAKDKYFIFILFCGDYL